LQGVARSAHGGRPAGGKVPTG